MSQESNNYTVVIRCVLHYWLTHIPYNERMTVIYIGLVKRDVPHHVLLFTRQKMSCSWYKHQIVLQTYTDAIHAVDKHPKWTEKD